MLISRHQNAGKNQDIQIENRPFENVSQFTYLGTTLTIQNLIQDEIKRRVNSSNACYHSAQSLVSDSSCLLSKNAKIKIRKAIIFPVVMYGCETWSLTLREEHRRSVFENRVLRGIIGQNRDEVTGEWRKLHNEKLRDLYSSPTIINPVIKNRMIMFKRMRWAGHVARMEKRNAYKLLVGKPEGKRPLRRPRRR
jgi:hypothetical protein